jgi:uncharacterized protein YbcI
VPHTNAVQAISSEVAHIHATAYRQSVDRISTTIDADSIVCELRIMLSPDEASLLGTRARNVSEDREALDHTLGPTLSAVIERATGRRVSAFLTKTRVAPSVTLFVFTLSPTPF